MRTDLIVEYVSRLSCALGGNGHCLHIRAGGGTMWTKFWQNYFLGKGFAKTSAHLFLNSEVANGKGGVW